MAQRQAATATTTDNFTITANNGGVRAATETVTVLVSPPIADTVIATFEVGISPNDAGVGGSPAAVVFSPPNGSRAYVTGYANGGGTVSVINTATATVIATIATGINSYPKVLVISPPNGNDVYVANDDQVGPSGTVSVINTATNTVASTISVGEYPAALALS